MNKILAAALALTSALMVHPQSSGSPDMERIVILHTNDTHSQIDPDSKDLGGILRRKVLIDSIRNAEKNVLLIDAGDAVQGSVYFTLFGGEVERKMMNALGYDYQIMGNHELDNGVEALARQWTLADAELLSTNYDLSSGTPLESIVKPYAIRQIGGRKIGLIAINVDPYGLVSPDNYAGVRYLDGLKAANATAWHLKHNEKCDLVIAVTHIGYKSRPGCNDCELAAESEDIDLIIGGHSHTLIDPAGDMGRQVNAKGDTILLAQLDKGGARLGQIVIEPGRKPVAKLIQVDRRLDSRIDSAAAAILNPYRHSVDSILSIPVGKSLADFPHRSTQLSNLVSDFVSDKGSALAGRKVDMAIMNRGGIRCGMPKGVVTKGLMMQMLPFDNRVVVIEIKGRDLQEAFDVMAARGGDAISREARARINKDTRKAENVEINGEPIDPQRIYLVATIDYLAKGGDYMEPLTRGKLVMRSHNLLYDDVMERIGHLKGKKIKADETQRWY